MTGEKEIIVDFSDFDVDEPVASKAQIEALIPQRFEMSQLDGILFEDPEQLRYVGYKDVTSDEFWVRGHMPDYPLMPGVIACECAAQLSAYVAAKHELMDGMCALGGLDKVRFRGPIGVGKRLIIMVTKKRLRPNAVINCRFQCFVDQELVAEGEIKGVRMPKDALADLA